MPQKSHDVASYLASTSEKFRGIFEDLKKIVMKKFSHAHEGFMWNMPGWTIKLKNPPPPKVKGTIPHDCIAIFLVERKAGITFHIWNPFDYYLLSKNKKMLEKEGFQVMQGCLQFNKKTPYPLSAIKSLLEKIKQG